MTLLNGQMRINNKITRVVCERVDAAVRFIYCRVKFIRRILFWRFYSSDFAALDKEFERAEENLSERRFYFKDKVCLELGPGNSYINAYNMLAYGARKVVLVDKFPRQVESRRQKELFMQELNYIRGKCRQKNLPFGKRGVIDRECIEFLSGDISDIAFKEKFDFIYSVSVMEHIKDVRGVIRKFREIINDNGMMYHSIDMRDHYNFAAPFLFYKYSRGVWEKYLTKEGVSYTNRLRYYDYKNLFRHYGFEPLSEETVKYPVNHKKINSEFKGREDLDVGFLRIVLRKTTA